MWHRYLLVSAPALDQVCIHFSWAIAYAHLGARPDANRYNVGHIWGGAFIWTGLALLLLGLLVLPAAIRWGVREKQWRFALILAGAWALNIALLWLDPLGARAWFLY